MEESYEDILERVRSGLDRAREAKAKDILTSILDERGFPYIGVHTKILDCIGRVGVQGDSRTVYRPLEIMVYSTEKMPRDMVIDFTKRIFGEFKINTVLLRI